MKTVEERQRLHIKSYFAPSMEAALGQARRELGPEALLVNCREAPPEARHLGNCEAVFAFTPSLPTAERTAPAERPVRNADPVEPADAMAMQKQLKAIWDLLSRMTPAGMGLPVPSPLVQRLIDAGLDAEMAAEIVQSLGKRFGTNDARLEAELADRFTVDPGLTVDRDQAQTVVLVGPPGAGKTSTLVKLAVRYGLHTRRGMHLISMDTMRIGAAEQLRSYAAVLGVSFQAIETGRALAQALEEHRNKSLILVDTGGYSSANLADAADLAICLSEHPEVDTHLVAPASMKASDLERTVRAFEIFGPSKLLFTKVDETDSLGSLFCVAARTGKSISFLSAGPAIPEDLELATKERILQPILHFEADRSEVAA